MNLFKPGESFSESSLDTPRYSWWPSRANPPIFRFNHRISRSWPRLSHFYMDKLEVGLPLLPLIRFKTVDDSSIEEDTVPFEREAAST